MNEEELYPLMKPRRDPLPVAFKGVVKNLSEMGHIYELNDYMTEERTRIGLAEKPPTAYRFKEALKEVKSLMANTEMARKVNQIRKNEGEAPTESEIPPVC